jgi:hypothetical protein
MVYAPTFGQGLRQLRADNVTEYGHTINALQRFNLYPEVSNQIQKKKIEIFLAYPFCRISMV